ncbi:restriction endonuclease subunit S [Reichenbachiella ulvae]|uniref:Restriction endonuclease subunit S n=1 Tax=Reichenbachiella ulvae TaxID=2980104 RepID=A0ABT3CUQ6_9BACT|nr:restriction endonuclease subunit S [Reichenbachiella ulvae]MCV9387430.1 restriction endonuclease subunit S [Reichenbachiella ulvae]
MFLLYMTHNQIRHTNPELAAQFPSSFEYNETLGKWIPEGWEVKALGEITTELRRGISPKYIEEGGVLVLNQKCIRNHEVDFSLGRRNDPTKKKVDGRLLQVGDMVVNSTGTGTLGRVANIKSLSEPTTIDSHVTVLRPDTEKVCSNYFNGIIFSIEKFIEDMGEGSTGQTELSRARLSEVNVLLASNEIQEIMDLQLHSVYKKQDANQKQILTLTQLRDALLPQLISGRVRLSASQITQMIG